VRIRTIALGVVLVFVGLPVALILVATMAFRILDRSSGRIASSGEEREYLLHVPSSYDPAKPTPLVISMHGAAMWPAQQRSLSGWSRLADEQGFP
jgi:poly(3-hydroxybutyrate) depolymerase